MARGRKRKAPHLRLVDDRTDRDTGVRPESAEAAEIHPPASMRLTESERARFYELVREMDAAGFASPTYARLLAQIARREEDVMRMRAEMIEGLSRVVTSTQGERVSKAHPLLTHLQEAERHLSALYAAACLTPADVSKAIKTRGEEKPQGNPFLTHLTRTT